MATRKQERKWERFVDEALREISELSALRTFFQPLRDYVESKIDRLGRLLFVLVIVQSLVALFVFFHFAIDLRTIVIAGS